ncbi:MAG: LysR family transcriptional regulator [Methylococcaceae bacterium]|nr:LysR family transcriptional regulator [Methylococcaceae bacterium]
MDMDQIKTFVSVASNGSFQEAAKWLHVTQSTVSARIQKLESTLRTTLFVRNRSGAQLTANGRQFLRHAKTLMLTLDQARYDIGLPDRFTGSIRIGARIALWEELLPKWLGQMRTEIPDYSFHCDIGFEEDLMRRLKEGTLDIGLMYTPHHGQGLNIVHLFDETLALYTTELDKPWPDDNYVYVDWGPDFYARHNNSYPDLERPAQVVNIGWLAVQLIMANRGSCFLPTRMANPLVKSKKLFPIIGSLEFKLPAYLVYRQTIDKAVLSKLLTSLSNFTNKIGCGF